jgi:hypothetical protein
MQSEADEGVAGQLRLLIASFGSVTTGKLT